MSASYVYILNMSISGGRKHPAFAGLFLPSRADYPHFEQILYSISFAEALAPVREAAMRQANAGVEQDSFGRGAMKP